MRLCLVASLAILAALAGCTPSSEDLPPPPAVPDAGSGGITRVSGEITADATWSGDVQLTGDVTIAAGVTVTIAAGTHVVAADAGLAVSGTLVVAGTAAQQVSFDASAGSWSGIAVQSGGKAQLTYANLTQAATAFDCGAGAAGCSLDHVHIFTNVRSAAFAAAGTITYSTLERTSSIGIAVSSGADLSISDSHLTTAGGDIVVQNGGKLKIDYSEIGKVVDSYEHCGIHINRADGLVIEHSDLHSNVYGGMIGGTTNARINYCNWTQNNFDVDDLGGNVGLDLKNNYWDKAPPSAGDTSGAASSPLSVGPHG
jgi:Periplasmic copper-binding protein (NosD)